METSSPIRKIDNYILGSMLGKGFFGHVRAARKLNESTLDYAIKYMKIGKPHSKENLTQLLRQEAMLQKLRHRNILKIYEVNSDGLYEKIESEPKKIPVAYVVLQLARSGDLFDFVAGSGGLSENVARFYFVQILNAVEYLHSLGIAHRDIKPENILLDRNFNPLLTDFGLCKKLSETGFTTNSPMQKVGTERCMSPELLAGFKHSPVKDDLFALGYLLFILVARHPPFLSASITNAHYRLLKENKVLEYWKAIDSIHPPGWCTDDFKHLITLMFSFDMTIRPSIAEIRAHPWVQGQMPTEAEVRQEFEQRQAFTLEHQLKEARERKQRKEEAKRRGNAKGLRKGFGPHKLKRSVTAQATGEADVTQLRMTKKLKVEDFGEASSHKPTILMSEETVNDIETALISYFASAKSIKIDQNKYKVTYTCNNSSKLSTV